MMFFLHVSFFLSLYVSFAFFTRLSLSLSFIFICHMFIFIDEDDHIYSWTHFTHIRLYLYIITYYNKGTWHGKEKVFCTPSYSTSFPLKNNSAMINLIYQVLQHIFGPINTRAFSSSSTPGTGTPHRQARQAHWHTPALALYTFYRTRFH